MDLRTENVSSLGGSILDTVVKVECPEIDNNYDHNILQDIKYPLTAEVDAISDASKVLKYKSENGIIKIKEEVENALKVDEVDYMVNIKEEIDTELVKEEEFMVNHEELMVKDEVGEEISQQSSQWPQNIIIETGHNQDQLNTRHTINVIVNNNKKERQQRYREQNREKLKKREAERRKRIQYLQSIARPPSSSNINNMELKNDEIIAAISQSSSGLKGIQPLSIQKNEQAKKDDALLKKRERQQRYRVLNREKLKQREAERRQRLQKAEMITELSTPLNIEFTEIINR